MELTLINLAQMIVANKGLDEPMSLDSLNIYFDNFNEANIRPFGKIKNGHFYPNNNVWKTAIALLIEDSIEYTNRLLKEKEYTYEVYKKYKIGIANFNCYLSKFKLSLLIDMDKFVVFKDGTKVTVISKQVAKMVSKARKELQYLEEIIGEASLAFEDQSGIIIVNNKKLAAKLVHRGFGKLTNKNKLALNKEVLQGIFYDRLDYEQNSINTELTDALQNEASIFIINTPLALEDTSEILKEFEDYYELLRYDNKKNINNQTYLQMIFRIKPEQSE